MENEFISPKLAGQLLDVTTGYVRVLAKRGELEAVLIAGRHVYRRSEVEALAEKRQQKAA